MTKLLEINLNRENNVNFVKIVVVLRNNTYTRTHMIQLISRNVFVYSIHQLHDTRMLTGNSWTVSLDKY